MAMCVMAVVEVAPCQCFSPGAIQTMSPGLISSIGPPYRCTQPRPDVTDQSLSERMGMPGRARTRLEGDSRTADPRRLVASERGVDSHSAGEIFSRSWRGRLRAAFPNIHVHSLRFWP
jgi:hypothetical protein